MSRRREGRRKLYCAPENLPPACNVVSTSSRADFELLFDVHGNAATVTGDRHRLSWSLRSRHLDARSKPSMTSSTELSTISHKRWWYPLRRSPRCTCQGAGEPAPGPSRTVMCSSVRSVRHGLVEERRGGIGDVYAHDTGLAGQRAATPAARRDLESYRTDLKYLLAAVGLGTEHIFVPGGPRRIRPRAIASRVLIAMTPTSASASSGSSPPRHKSG